jgi:hypothetical protein
MKRKLEPKPPPAREWWYTANDLSREAAKRRIDREFHSLNLLIRGLMNDTAQNRLYRLRT